MHALELVKGRLVGLAELASHAVLHSRKAVEDSLQTLDVTIRDSCRGILPVDVLAGSGVDVGTPSVDDGIAAEVQGLPQSRKPQQGASATQQRAQAPAYRVAPSDDGLLGKVAPYVRA